MPTLHGMKLPQPKDWQEFEKITRDAMALKWKSPNLQMNGRSGQKQHGVDIYGLDYLGRPVGIQCKNFSGPLPIKAIEAEVANAENYVGKLTALFLATTGAFDADLQKQVRVISEKRTSKDLFAVGLLFWDDIFSGLTLDPKVLRSHYPQLRLLNDGQITSESSAIAALVVGYYGSSLWKYLELIFGEFGWLAQEDPTQGKSLLMMVRRNLDALQLADMHEMVDWLTSIEDEIFVEDTESVNWDRVTPLAKSFANRVRYLPDILIGHPEAEFIAFGITLGRYYHAEGKFAEDDADIVRRRVARLLPQSTPKLNELFETILGKECSRAATTLHSFVDNEIRWPRHPAPLDEGPSDA
jgi:hypothetical protein